jgi:hypothetical protein
VYEADQRHAEIMVKQLGWQVNSNSVVTPGVNDNGVTNERESSAARRRVNTG